jgi:hypothetical protein
MRERLKQLTAVTVLALVAGVSLVACSDENEPGTDAGGESSGDTLTQANFFDRMTAAQKKAGTTHVAMAVKVAGQSLKADGDMSIGENAGDTAMEMKMDSGQSGLGSLEMRLVDQVFYLNFGPMTSNKFAQIDLGDESNPIGKQYADIVGNIDPSQNLKQYEEAVTGFDQKGKAIELDGVQAQPYVIRVDPSKIPEAKNAGESLPKSLDYTMYIGPDDLPRRVVTELPAVAGGGGSTMTVNYTKWGEEVSITKPEPSEITKKDFFSQLGSPTPEA